MTPAFPDFPKDEYEARWNTARAHMAKHDLDALWITERLNYEYFSGHRSAQNPIDKIRSYMFILPKDDDPILITMPFEVAQVVTTTWIQQDRIEVMGGLTGHVEFVSNVLKKRGLAHARIGTEMGREQYLGMNYKGFNEVIASLPEAEFIDAAQVILDTRLIKSAREIEYLRQSARLNAQTQQDILPQIEAGMTENEVARILRTELFNKGAETLTLLSVISGVAPEGASGMILSPTDKVIQKGEALGFDVGVTIKGYTSDLARTFCIGQPSDEMAEFYDWMMQLRRKADACLKPGKSPAELIDVVEQELAARGMKTSGVGRVGHGVGFETTEYPSLAAFEDIQFAPGMVFACNPNFSNEFGFINAEDNWVITEDGADLLSDPMADLQMRAI
ncbi:hypothetical protein RA19_14855 [Leisingera sp. ANG-M1]|uniref:M24 family metallopeptidase n=1 Tax=Leisingera sp. ANG-M1 TaxID=1577895 RepID=UPI00057ED293|nr:Xaa-Pro peptidase family protein [Leisingera sp. ANG-M1]KIC09599.1 hypothetical protein RA19_14855 [Leisingera sp. ANG-M1]